MSPEEAEEYTEALAQIGAGWWRQRVLAIQLKVPEALGQSIEEWAGSLGAGVKLAIPERREAVLTLTGPPEDGGLDLTDRQAAAVLGVGVGTVSRDQHVVPNGTPDPVIPDKEDEPSVPDGTGPESTASAAPEPVDEPAAASGEEAPSWSAEEEAIGAALGGDAIFVVSYRTHPSLIAWAEAHGLFVRIDRRSDWGNPFEMPGDGDRAAVIANYETHYLPHKPSLLERLGELRGKALGCWCAPEPCHGDVLKRWAERAREPG